MSLFAENKGLYLTPFYILPVLCMMYCFYYFISTPPTTKSTKQRGNCNGYVSSICLIIFTFSVLLYTKKILINTPASASSFPPAPPFDSYGSSSVPFN